jgi:hypothetical protein
VTLPDDEDGELLPVPAVAAAAPTEVLKKAPPSAGLSVALRGRIPAAALARGTQPIAGRVPAPPHSAAVAFGPGAGIVVEIDGDRVTLSTPTGRVTGTRAQTRDLIDALLDALTR